MPLNTRPASRFLPRLRRLVAAAVACAVIAVPFAGAQAASRIKDIAEFEGVRENQLVGYGLVVGLNGTGDSLKKSVFTRESLIGMLERLGVNAREEALDSKNVAAVMVTALLPPFARQGTKMDVRVSALGDARDLQGGTLLVTPMLGADGEIYAVAQGPVATGGFSASGAAETVTKGVPTSGSIASGGIVEREVPFALASLSTVKIALRNPDLTTARRVADAINQSVGTGSAQALDPGTVQLFVPEAYSNDMIGLLTTVEQLQVDPDTAARVVIDEESGIVVMGENVRISTVAIAQGNLTIRITETPQVSQPSPLSTGGATTTVPRSDVDIQEDEGRKLMMLNAGVSLEELVNGLNTLGVGPRDMISILQAIKTAGALQADVEVR
jgi:flagellar P-ring protein precursor FlgI